MADLWAMRRASSAVLAVFLLAIGTGTLEYFHNLQDAMEDAVADVLQPASGHPDTDHPQHDESNCPVHARLHMQCVPAGWMPVVLLWGRLFPPIPEIVRPLISRAAPYCAASRGPPLLISL